jgi:membrane protein DedA with SNARE-associated domain
VIAELYSDLLAALLGLFSTAGWPGVVVILAFEAATGLSSSEVVLGLAGWILLASQNESPAQIFLAGLWASLGSLAGTSFTYWMVRTGGRPLVERTARRLRIDTRYIHFVEEQFRRRGPSLVLFGRLVPGIRILIAVPAGLARMPFFQFLIFSFIGSYIWCTTIIGLGYTIGHEWPAIAKLIGGYVPFFMAGLAFLAAAGLIAQWLVRRKLLARSVAIIRDRRDA